MSRQARRVELTSRAERDLRRITPKDAARVVHALRQLALPEAPPNLDIKLLEGLPSWLRLRVGDYRVLYTQRSEAVFIARIIHRRDLDRALRSLEP